MLTSKKQEKIRFEQLSELAPPNLLFISVDPTVSADLERIRETVMSTRDEPSVRHILLHKITDFAKEEGSSVELANVLGVVGKLLEEFPEVKMINSIKGLKVLADRWETCNWIKDKLDGISIPKSVLYDSGDKADCSLKFPCLWKPLSACGHPSSHSMLFLPSPSTHLSTDIPGLLQEFIRHRRILYKVFVVGETVRIDIRPSLGTALFGLKESGDFDSDFIRSLEPLSEDEIALAEKLVSVPSMQETVIKTSERLRGGLDLDLFGWDLIIGEDGIPYIIDVNNFPKFEGFTDFHQHLLHLLLKPE